MVIILVTKTWISSSKPKIPISKANAKPPPKFSGKHATRNDATSYNVDLGNWDKIGSKCTTKIPSNQDHAKCSISVLLKIFQKCKELSKVRKSTGWWPRRRRWPGPTAFSDKGIEMQRAKCNHLISPIYRWQKRVGMSHLQWLFSSRRKPKWAHCVIQHDTSLFAFLNIHTQSPILDRPQTPCLFSCGGQSVVL